jgi:hypothetical protein
MTIDRAGEQTFYKALGAEMSEAVELCEGGLTMDGHFTVEQLRAILAAYNNYLSIPLRSGSTHRQ